MLYTSRTRAEGMNKKLFIQSRFSVLVKSNQSHSYVPALNSFCPSSRAYNCKSSPTYRCNPPHIGRRFHTLEPRHMDLVVHILCRTFHNRINTCNKHIWREKGNEIFIVKCYMAEPLALCRLENYDNE